MSNPKPSRTYPPGRQIYRILSLVIRREIDPRGRSLNPTIRPSSPWLQRSSRWVKARRQKRLKSLRAEVGASREVFIPDDKLDDILDGLLAAKLIQLPERKKPEEVDKTEKPKVGSTA